MGFNSGFKGLKWIACQKSSDQHLRISAGFKV